MIKDTKELIDSLRNGARGCTDDCGCVELGTNMRYVKQLMDDAAHRLDYLKQVIDSYKEALADLRSENEELVQSYDALLSTVDYLKEENGTLTQDVIDRLERLEKLARDRSECSSTGDGLSANRYQKLAMRTCDLFGPRQADRSDMIRHAVFGLTSEAGEVAGLFQKTYQGHEIDREHLKKELGDVLWMVAELCTAVDFDMGDVMHTNIEKLRKRYPDGFSAEKSLHRQEGDV